MSNGNRDQLALVRRDRRDFDRAGLNDGAADRHAPAELQLMERDEVIPIGDAELVADPSDFDRLDNLLVLDQTGGWLPVGEHETVADEVAVIWDIAEITAVGEPLTTIGRALPDAVVAPFPDATAHDPVVLVERIFPILGQSAGAVTHRVSVFALQERLARVAGAGPVETFANVFIRAFADGDAFFQPRIHPAIHVGDLHVVVTFVMNRAARIERAGEVGHGRQVAAKTSFVAQRPEDDAGMVLVAVNRAFHPIDTCAFPARVVRWIAGPVFLQAEPVRLEIAFVDDVKAILIAQVEEARVVGVMRGANRVDIVLLH